MDRASFWSLIELIEGDGKDDSSTNLEPLISELSKKSGEQIADFYEMLAQVTHALDTSQHYRRFSWFRGHSDTFLYTRLSVVAQGSSFYHQVLENPKMFPKRSSRWLEELLYVADEAFRKSTGGEFDRDSTVCIESFSNEKGWAK
ncbi:DUF4240 domain-containing protein [Cognatishimia maritima]|uniref:DUF4240 domain-containing protein n=1 Tax=Cognatishimia maritima TaxID=870908 RepID=A0A1M5VI62_9RHOB|nr:DUF4240 domain-containing protein [Cognatishimia maritima]SHH74936.1 Protein of unknown function [Cognatishimia maritima]